MEIKENKKAQTMFVIGLIVVIIGGIILFLYATQLRSSTMEFSYMEKCKMGILKAAAAEKFTVNLEPDCPSDYIKFYNDHAELRYETDKGFKTITLPIYDKKMETKYNELTDDIITSAVSDAMVRCWKKLGEGKLDFFHSDWLNSKISCITCSYITFDPSLDKETYKFDKDWLKNNYLRSKVDGKRMKYYDYLYQSDVTFEWLDNEYETPFVIPEFKRGETYKLIFVGLTLNRVKKLWTDIKIENNDKNPRYTMFLVPVNDEGITKCEYKI